MATWSGIRNKLENDYLAESLRGRIQYFVTRYRLNHDQEGRTAIRLDGKEVLQGNFYNFYLHEHLLSDEVRYKKWNIMNEAALDLGMFDQRSFYWCFDIYNNQSIEESLVSDNLLIRIFAILDRRVGKRRLIAMADDIDKESSIFKFFYLVRIEAEGVNIC